MTPAVSATSQAAPASASGSVLDTIVHDLFLVAVTAASIFVKNPRSQTQAQSLLGVASELLQAFDTSTGQVKKQA